MAATPTAADGVLALRTEAKPTTLLPLSPQGNACKSRLPSASGGAIVCASTKEEPGWTTRHRATSQKQADCRPLLQQSSPNRGQVVQPGKRRNGINSRLNLCA
jgi:hypothetical protein